MLGYVVITIRALEGLFRAIVEDHWLLLLAVLLLIGLLRITIKFCKKSIFELIKLMVGSCMVLYGIFLIYRGYLCGIRYIGLW